MIGKLERYGYKILNRKTSCPQLWAGCGRLCGQQLFRTDDHYCQPGGGPEMLSIAGIQNEEFIVYGKFSYPLMEDVWQSFLEYVNINR